MGIFATVRTPADEVIEQIERNELEILDVVIAALVENFWEHLFESPMPDMEEAAAFVVAAATLLEWKSKSLLPAPPKDEAHEPTPEELEARLSEYKHFAELANLFMTRGMDYDKIAFRGLDVIFTKDARETYPINEILNGVSMEMLNAAFQDVLNRRESRKDMASTPFTVDPIEEYSIEQKQDYICALLNIKKRVEFENIFAESGSKLEMIVIFLALLELMRSQVVTLILSTSGIVLELKKSERHKL